MRPLRIVRAMALAVALLVVGHGAGVRAEATAPLVPELPESATFAPRGDGFLTRVGASRWQHWRTSPLRLVGEHVAIDAAWRPDSGAFVLLDGGGVVKLVEVTRPTVERVLATAQPRAHAIAGFFPDGRRVLLATNAWESDRNVVIELDVTSGQARTRLAFRRMPALAVPSPAKLDPTGHWLAVQRADTSPSVLQVWNLESDELIDVACQHGKQLAWSRDGQKLAADCGPSLKLFEAADRFAIAKIYLVPETGEPRFSPRGDRMWRVPDPIRGPRRATVMKTTSAHEAPEWNDGVLDWSEGNVQLTARDFVIALRDVASQRVIDSAGVRVAIATRVVGEGALRIAHADAETVLDLERGQVVLAPKARPFEREDFVAIGDRRSVMSLGPQRTMVKLPDDVMAEDVVSVSPDGRFLVTSTSATSLVIDRKSNARTSVAMGELPGAAWSPDGGSAYLANAAKAVVWRPAQSSVVPVPIVRPLAGAWSAKGTLVVANTSALWWSQGSRSGQLALPRLRKKNEEDSPARKIRFSADGSRVLVSSCGNRDYDETVAFRVEASGLRPLGPAKRGGCDQTWIGNDRFVPAAEASPHGRLVRAAIKAAGKDDRLLFPADESRGRVAIEQRDRILVVEGAGANQQTLRDVPRPAGFRALGLFRGGALLVLSSERAVKLVRVADGKALDVYGVGPRADGQLDVWLFAGGERVSPDALAAFCVAQ